MLWVICLYSGVVAGCWCWGCKSRRGSRDEGRLGGKSGCCSGETVWIYWLSGLCHSIFSDAVGLKTLTFRSNYNKENDYINNICIRLNLQAVGTVSPPPACSPDEVSHGYITIKVLISISASNLLNYENTTQSWNAAGCLFQPGVRTHYVEMGSGPPVLLCHGFPESWYSWRYQVTCFHWICWNARNSHLPKCIQRVFEMRYTKSQRYPFLYL